MTTSIFVGDMTILLSDVLNSEMLYTPASSLFVVAVVYLTTIVLQRLVFSPIAKFPGPRLAGKCAGTRFVVTSLQNHSIDILV